jgi:transcriptional regulator with XRE-family HTH domain
MLDMIAPGAEDLFSKTDRKGTIGAAVLELRRRSNLTQPKLAAKLFEVFPLLGRVSPVTIYTWEVDRRKPRRDALFALSEVSRGYGFKDLREAFLATIRRSAPGFKSNRAKARPTPTTSGLPLATWNPSDAEPD